MGNTKYLATFLTTLILGTPLFAQEVDSLARLSPVYSNTSLNVDDNAELARAYRLQAQHIEAMMADNDSLAAAYLNGSVSILSNLIDRESWDEDDRIRALYQTVAVSYFQYYGETDSLYMPFGNIFGYREAMFAKLNTIDEPLLENVELPELGWYRAEVPMSVNRLVANSITYLLDSPERHLFGWLNRSETYFPMIEQILAEEGVPDELKYLAMIESGLNPKARSWARAVGMWQFISATGRAYGLTVNGWVDERMDPEKATRAAARHLKDLHERFGDWHLALAGYNYSPGKLSRKVRAAEERLGRKATYWDVYNEIPRETRNYVPMFIAASLVASQPEAFGISIPNPGPEYSYHVVPVYGVHSLETIAGLANSDTRTVRALNPELSRGMLPPSKHPYPVKIPVGTYDTFVSAYENLPPELRSPAEEHTVHSGETLGGIASKYGTSVSQLMRLNGMTKTRIYPGQRLAVPTIEESYASQDNVVGPNPIQYPRSMTRPIAVTGDETEDPQAVFARVRQESLKPSPPVVNASIETTQKAEPKANKIIYTVKKGDTLGEIAEEFHVRASNIRSWNNIRGSKIRVGQKLTIYSNAATSNRVTYRVKRGDTLSGIASKYGVSISDIRKWNGLKSSRIQVGQTLVINT